MPALSGTLVQEHSATAVALKRSQPPAVSALMVQGWAHFGSARNMESESPWGVAAVGVQRHVDSSVKIKKGVMFGVVV